MSDEYAVLRDQPPATCTLFTYTLEFVSPEANRFMLAMFICLEMVIHRDLLTTSLDHIHEQLLSTLMIFIWLSVNLAGEKIMYSPRVAFLS